MARLSQKQARSTPGRSVSKVDRDDAKKKASIAKKQQQHDYAMKELERRRKEWEAHAKGLARIKRKVDELLKSGEDRGNLDKDLVNAIKKTSEFIKKTSKDAGTFAEVLQNPKELGGIASAAGKIGGGNVQTYTDLSVALGALIVLLYRMIKMKIEKKKFK